MGKIISKARQLRLEWAARQGAPVTVQEAADKIGISRKRLTALELDNFDEVSRAELAAFCEFYGRVLERPIGPGDLMGYDSNNKWALDPAMLAAQI